MGYIFLNCSIAEYLLVYGMHDGMGVLKSNAMLLSLLNGSDCAFDQITWPAYAL